MIKGPYKNREDIFQSALQLRMQGYGYRSIASRLNVSWNTVRNWVKHIPVEVKTAYDKSLPLRSRKKTRTEDCGRDSTRRELLIRLHGRLCWNCKLSEWMGKPIPLELNHINGDRENNKESNLEVICPNCHAQTPTYKVKNIKAQCARVVERADTADLKPAAINA